MRTSRPGVTLIEVLAAIFIMGVGTLAVLVLFPLGALNMARALKDDRAGTIAANAESLAYAFKLHTDSTVVTAMTTAPAGLSTPPPNSGSYVAFVDPFYSTAHPTVGGLAHVRRVSPGYVDPTNPARWFSFYDDLTFETDGRPHQISGNTGLERQGLYTWAYLLRRLQTSNASTTDYTVIVYSGRAIQVPVPEIAYNVDPVGSAGDTSITLSWNAGDIAPSLRRGNWLLDSTYATTPNAAGTGTYGRVHGRCYRVMDAVSVGATSLQVEIQPPLRDGNVRQMVVLDNAVEVFERGTGN